MQKIYTCCADWENGWSGTDPEASHGGASKTRNNKLRMNFLTYSSTGLFGSAWIYKRLASMWWVFSEWKESWAFQIYCPVGPKLLWNFTPLYVTGQHKEACMSHLFLYATHVTCQMFLSGMLWYLKKYNGGLQWWQISCIISTFI